MKKVALSLLALAVVAAGAFADAPKWDPKVTTELKGDASVTFGYDLDQGVYGFKNATSTDFVIDLVSGGDRSTSSDQDVWGEIKVKTDGDPIRLKAAGATSGFTLLVDYAKIHFGKTAYVSVTSYDTKIGYANSPDLAWFGHKYDGNGTQVDGTVTENVTRYGHDAGRFIQGAFASQGAASAGGFEVGYSLENIANFTVLLGSVKEFNQASVELGTKNAEVNKFAYEAAIDVTAVPNLTLGAGYSSSNVKETASAVGGKVGYKLELDGEKLFLKPLVGVVQTDPAGKANKPYLIASAGVLLGTGAKGDAFDNFDLKYGSDDYGSYPGVSFGVFYSNADVVNKANDKKADTGLNISANSGAVVADLSAVASYEITDINAKDKESLINLGLAYSTKSGDVTFAPKAFVAAYSKKDAIVATGAAKKNGSSSLFIRTSTDITGVIPFVTFNIATASNDLTNGYGFLDPDTGKGVSDKNGKIEFTTKVSF